MPIVLGPLAKMLLGTRQHWNATSSRPVLLARLALASLHETALVSDWGTVCPLVQTIFYPELGVVFPRTQPS